VTVETLVSYARNGEDVVLWRALRHVPDGRYVDVGAGDPVEHSVTKALYQRGWRGIDIEASASHVERLREDRPEDEVVHAAEGDAPMVALESVLRESRVLGPDLHVLRVAPEGDPAPFLTSLDLDRWRPWVVVVASGGTTLGSPAAADRVLNDAGFGLTLFDGISRFYLSADHPELRADLAYPACARDAYERAEQVHAVELLAQERERRLALESEVGTWRNRAGGFWTDAVTVAQELERATLEAARAAEQAAGQSTRMRARLSSAQDDRRRLRERVRRLEARVQRLQAEAQNHQEGVRSSLLSRVSRKVRRS